jgi:hypothetical protein
MENYNEQEGFSSSLKSFIIVCLIILVFLLGYVSYSLYLNIPRAPQNLNVLVDYGDSENEFESGYIIDEKNGKAKTFSSMVQAMNYMGQNGWEFVQAYTISEASGGQVYRWLLKINLIQL